MFLLPDFPFGSWQYLLSITSHGYVSYKIRWRIFKMADNLCESADDVKYKNLYLVFIK